jgi:hypothetical protein
MPAAGAGAAEASRSEALLLLLSRVSRREQPAATLLNDSSGEDPWPDIVLFERLKYVEVEMAVDGITWEKSHGWFVLAV